MALELGVPGDGTSDRWNEPGDARRARARKVSHV
jgi:hypothetical protein